MRDEPLQGLDINTAQTVLPYVKESLKGNYPLDHLRSGVSATLTDGPPFIATEDMPPLLSQIAMR